MKRICIAALSAAMPGAKVAACGGMIDAAPMPVKPVSQ
jgi:hypothetical protein